MKSFSFLYLLAAGALSYYLNFFLPEINSKEIIYWANRLYWLFILPVFIYLIHGYSKEAFPFVGITSLFLLLSFALPPFFVPAAYYQLGTLYPVALEWAFWGYFTFFASYYIFYFIRLFAIWPFRPMYIFDLKRDPQCKIIGYFFLILYVLNDYTPLSAIAHLSTYAFYVYLSLFFFLINRKSKFLNSYDRLIFYFFLSKEYLTRAFDGLLSAIAIFTLFLVVIFWYTSQKRVDFKLIRIGALVSLFLFVYIIFSPIKHYFRKEVWYSGKEYTLSERATLIYDLYQKRNLSQKNPSQEQVYENHFLWRYSYQASALSHVLLKTPSQVPFWKGSSYIFFSKLIPRFIWADKPTENMGYKFGTTYGIISADNKSTSINTPIIVEMYINFGFPGIVIGMFLLAIFYMLVNAYFNNIQMSDYAKIISISMIFNLISHESNFSLTFGNLPLLIISFYAIEGVLFGGMYKKQYSKQ